MEKFRLEQAQILLKDAAKSKTREEKLKTPKEGFINVDIFEKVLNDLFEAEEFIYSSRPLHKLDISQAEMFTKKIIAARNGIDGILSDFGVIENNQSEEDVNEYSKDLLILTTKNSFKKTITKFGVDPQRIVVAGVPLDPEDMKILNPKIPEAALIPIKKKIAHVKNDIERKMNQFNLKNVIVLVENDKPGEILGKRAKELYNARLITKENLRDISVGEFIVMVS
jgi:hypothetical protein